MKKISILGLSIIALSVIIFAGNLLIHSQTPRPQTVYRYIYVMESEEWYAQQAELWKKEVERDPHDAEAWRNYFMASKYSHWMGDKDKYVNSMTSILTEMAEYIPESYEYNYLKYYNGDRDLNLLKKAYQIDPKRPDALYEFVLHSEHYDDKVQLERYCRELYETHDIATGLLNYNYNMLASTEKNAILFTNGDNDSYPSWVLQQTFGIRKDVTVLNLHLTFVDRQYLKRKLSELGIDLDVGSYSTEQMSNFLAELAQNLTTFYPQFPVYAAVTVNKQSMSKVEENLYIVGLALKYSMKRFDNISSIRSNIQYNLRLDYLDYDWYNERYLVNKSLDNLHLNYVVFFLKYAEDLHQSGNDTEAKRWKEKALFLAKKASNEKFISYIEGLNW